MPCTQETIDNGPHFERMLCYVCTNVEAGNTLTAILAEHPELAEWWARHKRMDEAREQTERHNRQVDEARKAALAKLTPQERHLLGFNRP